jgi:hypothetical protein
MRPAQRDGMLRLSEGSIDGMMAVSNWGGGMTVAESGTMAKKKAETSKSTGKDGPRQGIILVYKGDAQTAPAIKKWLAGLADHVGAAVTVTVDMALKAFAEARGYKPMPRRRVR